MSSSGEREPRSPNERSFVHKSANGTQFEADRCDLKGGMTIRFPDWPLSREKLAQDIVEVIGFHALNIYPALNGAQYGGIPITCIVPQLAQEARELFPQKILLKHGIRSTVGQNRFLNSLSSMTVGDLTNMTRKQVRVHVGYLTYFDAVLKELHARGLELKKD